MHIVQTVYYKNYNLALDKCASKMRKFGRKRGEEQQATKAIKSNSFKKNLKKEIFICLKEFL